MKQSLLKLNEDKTEFLTIASPFHHDKLSRTSLSVGDAAINSSSQCRNLGIIFDCNLNMKQHVLTVCKSVSFKLRQIGLIRKYLSTNTCSTLIHAFITSRIDYCNSLLVNLPKYLLARLQKLQNIAARLLTCSSKYDHISPVLIKIHWLPISLRIRYKINLITFKCIHGLGPSYLSNEIKKYQPQRVLRSMDDGLLELKWSKSKSYGERAFVIAAPKLWNELPTSLRLTTDLPVFKTKLKTYLFEMFADNPSNFIY